MAVNPKDKRYKKYIGQEFTVDVGAEKPLKIKIIAEDGVEAGFGTGALGVTPANSAVDFEMYQKQKADVNDIGLIQIIDEHGRMMPAAGVYAGMSALEAREKFVDYLRKNNLLEKEENITQNVGTSDRFGDVIEPMLKLQWFVGVEKQFKIGENKLGIKKGAEVTLKELMQRVVHKKQIEIIPDHFEKTYFHWIDNLRDWGISRQIWYGHQIPVYYCKQVNPKSQIPNPKCESPIVSVDVVKKCPYCEGEIEQDPDTLDTWFSSGLWTFSTLGYPDLKAEDLKNYHPTSVMETGYDILFFWVARMILMTTYVFGDIPFKTVYLHGLVRDEKGAKMSKSLGNVINPLDMIAKYGTDATRLSLLLGNTPGNDMKLSEEKIAGFRNFTNKLWNISRYIFSQMITNSHKSQIDKLPTPETLADKWILGRLSDVIQKTTDNIENFNFSMAGEELRNFTWDDLADWYLEIAKVEGGKSEILNYILNMILKLWHPYMPFVTETIWQEVYGAEQSLMVASWPLTSPLFQGGVGVVVPIVNRGSSTAVGTEVASSQFDSIKNIIIGIRSLRAEYKIEPAKKIGTFINVGNKEKLLKENEEIIKSLARLEKLEFIKFGAEVSLDLAGAVDVSKEKLRLEKEMSELKKYVSGLENKLSNKEFVKNAPPAVVEKEKAKLSEAQGKLEKLSEQLKNLL